MKKNLITAALTGLCALFGATSQAAQPTKDMNTEGQRLVVYF